MINRVRLPLLLALAGLIAGFGALSARVTAAHASAGQTAIMEDDAGMFTDPYGTLAKMRLLGVREVRVPVRWLLVAPNAGSTRRPARFNAADPGARGYSWDILDAIDRAAAADGITLDFDVMGGAPRWANGRGVPRGGDARPWEPSARDYGDFVHAIALRYSGNYDPRHARVAPGNSADLPRISTWSIWNEPNYGPSLAPQGLPSNLRIDYSPQMYRGLVAAAYGSLLGTGHGRDTILFGELADRGYDYWGVYSGMRPIFFLRSLYCLDGNYRPLRGGAARVRGCPTDSGGSRRFRAANPALFSASGVSLHPYMRWYAPSQEPSPTDPITHQSARDYATLGTLGTFERALDRLQGAYGSRRHLAVYDTEFGYITSPPKRRWAKDRNPWIDPTTASLYLNWAEYLHWRDPRVAAYTQYLLKDPAAALASNDYGNFASGLISYGGQPKPTYAAWRLPLYLPVTSARRGSRLEVWGCIRPAPVASAEAAGPQTADIQLAPGPHPRAGAFRTVATVSPSGRGCYFDVRVGFAGTGLETVRLTWSYPASDPLGVFAGAPLGQTVTSRAVTIRLR